MIEMPVQLVMAVTMVATVVIVAATIAQCNEVDMVGLKRFLMVQEGF